MMFHLHKPNRFDPTLDNIDVIDFTATIIDNKIINFIHLNNVQM